MTGLSIVAVQVKEQTVTKLPMSVHLLPGELIYKLNISSSNSLHLRKHQGEHLCEQLVDRKHFLQNISKEKGYERKISERQ
uniref:Uncharacterized protein n=1 Tax=Physcomitrium patens TaxID=3218 RepID=A0A2K1IJD2_PHYPA|nr:hypothetical protein PHYPA_028079 [Physcomitrium patens]